MKRVVVANMSRKRGVPVNQSHFPFMDGAIPSSDLDVAVGLFGQNGGSGIGARLGIYQFSGLDLKLHHVVEMNPITGDPLSRQRKERGSPGVLAYDRATANWVKPFIFLDKELPVGHYAWTDDPPVPLSEVDVEERRRISGLAHVAPREDFFSMERTVQSSFEMVKRFMTFRSECGAPAMPEVFPFVTSRTARSSGVASQLLQQENVPFPLFRSIITNAMVRGLRVRDKSFIDIRHSFVSLLAVIDRAASSGGQRQVVESVVRRGSESIRRDAEAHIRAKGVEDLILKSCLSSIDFAITGLGLYCSDRRDGAISCFRPSGAIGSVEHPIFRQPDFVLVRPERSIQVMEVDDTSLAFSENWRGMFNV